MGRAAAGVRAQGADGRKIGRGPCLAVPGGGRSSGYPGERRPRPPGLEGLAEGSEEPGDDDPCWRRAGLNVPFFHRRSVPHFVGGELCYVDGAGGAGREGKGLASPKLAVTSTLLFGVRVSSRAGGQRLGCEILNYGHGERLNNSMGQANARV